MTDEDLLSIGTDLALLEGWRERHAGPLRNANANLRHYVRPYFEQNASIVSVTQRLKKISTILDKQTRYPTMRLTGMEDVGGVRAVLPTKQQPTRSPESYGRIGKSTATATTSANLRRYRALHLIVDKQGVKIEVQLRTYLQDYWANQVERDSRHLRVDYKSGKGHDAVHAYYVAMSELLAMREAGTEPSEAFETELRRRYNLARPYLAARPDEGTTP